MTKLLTAPSIVGAWIAGLDDLGANGRQSNDLLIEATRPDDNSGDQAVIDTLDRFLVARGWQDTLTVANTIFPSALAASSATRGDLYDRYQRMLPRLRRATPKNSKGIYFERLISYPLQSDPARSNQIETAIQGLHGAHRPGGLHHAYELQVFCPGKDLRPRGFPCLSSISLHVDGPSLRLSATYRNQYYVQKALGNILGLSWLQRFIANEAGLRQGPIVMHAFHAQVDPGVSGQNLDSLLASVRRQ